MTSKGVDVSRVYGENKPFQKPFSDVFQMNQGEHPKVPSGYMTMDKFDKPINSKRSINSKSSSYIGFDKNHGQLKSVLASKSGHEWNKNFKNIQKRSQIALENIHLNNSLFHQMEENIEID